jgi:hypothetical protein
MLNFFISANQPFLTSVGMKSLYSFLSRVNITSNVKLSVLTATNQSENLLKKFILRSAGIVAFLLVFGGSVLGQVSLITASDGGFENATSAFSNNGWTAVGTSTRTWRVGTLGGAATGTKAAFWGTTVAYGGTPSSAVGHFYRDIAIPAGATDVFLNYKLKYPTVDNTYDYFYVFTTTTSNTPVNGTIPSTGYTNRFTNTATAYAAFTAMPQVNLTALAGTTVRLVFTFKTDAASPNAAPAVDDITLTYITASACSGTPNTPTISGATSACSGVNFTLTSAGTSSGTGISYQWQSSTNGGTSWSPISGATATSLTTNASANTQYQLVTTCSNSGLTSTSAAYSVTISAFSACTCLSYPANYATSADDEDISNVTVGSMNNSSNCATAATGPGSILNRYANYAGVVTGPTAMQSSSVNFSLTQTTCGGNYGSFFQLYVDWNQDGDWLDAGEQVYSQGTSVTGNQTVTGSFTVPAGATVGVTRMRVVHPEGTASSANYAHNPLPISFGASYGETEDYCFTVVATTPCAGTPNPGNTISSPSYVPAPSGTVNLSLQTATDGTGVTYQWQSASTQTGTYSDIGGATSSTYSATVTSMTWFRCVVTCGGNSGTSEPVQVSLSACIPTMTYGCTDGDVVARVILNTLDNNSGTGCPSGTLGYSNYTTNAALTTTLQPSTSYNCIVYAGQYGANYAAWIDYNDNLIFETTERIGYTLSTVAGSGFVGVLGSSASFPVTLACTPAAGQHLLRIREVYNQTSGITITPCGNNEGLGYGEIEDYTITIAAAPACPSPGLVSTITPTSNSVALTWATNCSSATSYDFEYGPAGFTLGSGTLVSNQTVTLSAPNASYTLIGLQAGTSYDVYYRANCGSSTSAWSLTTNFTTLNAVSAASSTPTLCQGTAMTSITHNTQGATGIGAATGLPSGIIAAWSSNVITISGTPAASGVFSYSIPLTGGLGSVSAIGTITVLAAPSAPIATSPQVFCETANATIASLQVSGAVGSSFAWYSAGTGGGAFSNSAALSIGTVNYFVEQIGSNGCSSLTRTSVAVTESPLLSASVSITGTTACPGGVLLFTATPVNGGVNPTYQWYNNGAVILNEMASTYSASGLLPGDVINVKMVPSGSCVTVCP